MKLCNVLLMSVMAIAPSLHAQNAPTPAQIAQSMAQRYAIMLGLSSSQQEQAVTIFTAQEVAEETIHASQRTAQAALLTAIKADDTASLSTLSATLGSLSGEDTLAHSTAEAQFYAILTSEQQARFAQMMAQTETSAQGGSFAGPPRR